MKKNSRLCLLILPLLLSCSGKSDPKLEDYQSDLPLFSSSSTLRVLQLTDIHWNFTSDMEKEGAYLSALVKNANPDLIMTTGDNILSASKENISSLFDLFESFSDLLHKDVYYGFTWGNHDKQGMFDPSYPSTLALSKPHSLYKEVEDNLYGESNYYINLKKDGKTLWQLIALDSNSLHYSFPSFKYEYDIIHPEQIQWYSEVVKKAQQENPSVKSLLYFHIPLWETHYAYSLSQGEASIGHLSASSGAMEETPTDIPGLGETHVYAGYERTTLFQVAETLGSTKAMFYGHDHKNSFCAEYSLSEEKDPIALCYGLKSGHGLAYQDGRIGGNLAEIKEDGSLDLYRCYQEYEDDYSSQNGYRLERMFQ